MVEPKPGWKTTEWWTTIGAIILPVLLPGVDPTIAAAIVGGVAAIYATARAILKAIHAR